MSPVPDLIASGDNHRDCGPVTAEQLASASAYHVLCRYEFQLMAYLMMAHPLRFTTINCCRERLGRRVLLSIKSPLNVIELQQTNEIKKTKRKTILVIF